MLLLLLSSLFVLINGVPVALQPQLMELRQSNSTTKDPEGNLDVTNLKRGFDAKSLIEELADADPAKVQEVITLVEIMLQEAQADLDRLISESTDADNAYDIAVSNYDAAVVSQVQGVADRLEAERLEAEAVATAQSAKDVAEGAKTGARDNLDAEKTRLESEIASLEQVISILNGLISTTSGTFDLFFRQTAGTYNDKAYWSSVGAPEDPNYSKLNSLDDSYRGADGKFEFLIVWPNIAGSNSNKWKQTSNPMTKKSLGVDGYEGIDINFSGCSWGGLEYNTADASLLDGSVNHGNWYYAIGSKHQWGAGIPGGCGSGESVVELYVKKP